MNAFRIQDDGRITYLGNIYWNSRGKFRTKNSHLIVSQHTLEKIQSNIQTLNKTYARTTQTERIR